MDTGGKVNGAYRPEIPLWTRQLAPAFALVTVVTAVVAFANDRPWSGAVSLMWLVWAALLTWPPATTVVTTREVRVRQRLRMRSIPWTAVSEVLSPRPGDEHLVLRLSSGELLPMRGVPLRLAPGLNAQVRAEGHSGHDAAPASEL